MSVLTEALERVLNWLKQHQPNYASAFLPGLSLEKIEEKVKILPFHLTREVYKLYQWRNGTSSDRPIFVYHQFLDLDTAIEIALLYDGHNNHLIRKFRKQEGKPEYIFPIFNFEGEYFAVYEGLAQENSVFRVHHDEVLAFTSLASMMQTIAECYEIGGYSLPSCSSKSLYESNVDFDSRYYLELDLKKFEAIRRKYNPNVNNFLYKVE